MLEERRNISTRAAVVQRVIKGVVHDSPAKLTADSLQARLGAPPDAARRILDRLASSGLVHEVENSVWVRGASRPDSRA